MTSCADQVLITSDESLLVLVRAGQSGGGHRNSSLVQTNCSFCSDHWAAETRETLGFAVSTVSTVFLQSHWPAASRERALILLRVSLWASECGRSPGACVCVCSLSWNTHRHIFGLVRVNVIHVHHMKTDLFSSMFAKYIVHAQHFTGSHCRGAEELHVAPEPRVADTWSIQLCWGAFWATILDTQNEQRGFRQICKFEFVWWCQATRKMSKTDFLGYRLGPK